MLVMLIPSFMTARVLFSIFKYLSSSILSILNQTGSVVYILLPFKKVYVIQVQFASEQIEIRMTLWISEHKILFMNTFHPVLFWFILKDLVCSDQHSLWFLKDYR